MIAENDFQCEIAENGLVAFSKVKSLPKNYYDSILMDIHMPIMDGFEACERIYEYLYGISDIKSLLSNRICSGSKDNEVSKTKIFALSGDITQTMRLKIASSNFTMAFDEFKAEQIQVILKHINQTESIRQTEQSQYKSGFDPSSPMSNGSYLKYYAPPVQDISDLPSKNQIVF